MDYRPNKEKYRQFLIALFLVLNFGSYATALEYEYVENSTLLWPEFVPLERSRRDVASAPKADTTVPPTPTTSSTSAVSTSATKVTASVDTVQQTPNVVYHDNKTIDNDPLVANIPLLGVNGSGIMKPNFTESPPKASDPIIADDKLSDVMLTESEKVQAEKDMKNLTIDNHNFYNSSFIGNVTFFNEHWANITSSKPNVHVMLSNSHRRATTVKLSFEFPFYGHLLSNITVATGGFIFTGEHVHNWLAATQYIAPLMANFDTRLSNDSVVKLFDDGEKFTALWENVILKEETAKNFTFAVTLYNNGDIIFAYKQIPMEVSEIVDQEHPVKVGISDAYVTDKIAFYVRKKTIYEYHRVSFKDHQIQDNTMIKLVALPTCHQYKSCETCVNHDTGFNCSWCDQIQRCSSGTDRNKQDWILRNCERTTIVNATQCPAKPPSGNDTATSYYTNQQQAQQDTVIRTDSAADAAAGVRKSKLSPGEAAAVAAAAGAAGGGGSRVGGTVAAVTIVALLCSVAGWAVYAFKNPHTRSGQMFIKYRPSQWSWKRGEARYTAATIHM